MAKLNGPLGSKLRGKVGEIVAAKTLGGDTAIRAYQPVVKNPRTQKQVNNRASFSLLTKIAATISDVLALNTKKSETQRNAFIRNNFRFVAVDVANLTDGTTAVAKIPAASILLTNGGLDITADISFAAVTGQENKLKIVDAYTGADALGIAGAYVEVNGMEEILNITPFSFAASVTDKVISSPAGTRSTSMLLVYRLTASDESVRAVYEGLAGNEEGEGPNITQHTSRYLKMAGAQVSATAHIVPSV